MSGSAAAGTERFLNTLRVVGRMWGSHGDKITNAAQGRNFDDERAAFKSPGRAASPATGAGDEPGRSGAASPIIARQLSRDLALGSPTIARQASSVGRGEGATASPVSILRQTSNRELSIGVGVGGRAESPPLLIGRQASRDLIGAAAAMSPPLPEILRQQSRDRLGGGASSPIAGLAVPASPTSSSGVNVTATGFRPIATPPTSPTPQQAAPTSPVSQYLVPTLPPVANPTALRPGGATGLLARSPSSGAGRGGSPPPLLHTATSDFAPIAASLTSSVLGEADQAVSKGYHTNHRAEEAAAKAVARVVSVAAAADETKKAEAAPAFSSAAAAKAPAQPSPQQPEAQAKDSTAVVVDHGKAAPLTAVEKADIVRLSNHHKGGRKGSNDQIGSGSGRKKSLGASGGKKAAAKAAADAGADPSSSEGWRPGFYLTRLLSGGASGPEPASGEGSSKALVPSGPVGGEPNAA